MHLFRASFFFAISLHPKTKNLFSMKIKLTTEQIQKIVDDPVKASEAKIKVTDPWWIIVVKVIAYICGLILAGAATASCAAAAVAAI